MTVNIFSLDDQPWMTAPGRPCGTAEYPDAWFPTDSAETAEAKRLCAGCSVAAKCLDYALTFTDPITGGRLEGIWGGTTTKQRADARGDVPGRAQLRTSCHRGHKYDADNTRITGRGQRACRTCDRDAKRRAA